MPGGRPLSRRATRRIVSRLLRRRQTYRMTNDEEYMTRVKAHRRLTAQLWRQKNPERVKKYRKQYHANNREAQKAKSKEWRSKNGEATSTYCEKRRSSDWSVAVRLHDLMGRLRYSDKKLGRECTITDEDLVSLWHAQDGKCAVTRLPLTLVSRQPTSVSIDRIDNTLGHVPGNVHLTCKFVNLGRQSNSLSECLGFFEAFRQLVIAQTSSSSSSSQSSSSSSSSSSSQS